MITHIVRDYDQYVRRNLKRGATPTELNLSLLKQGEIKMEQFTGKIQKRLREEERNVKNNWESSRDELKEMLEQWEAKSQELIKDFSSLFDFRKIWTQLRKKRSQADLVNVGVDKKTTAAKGEESGLKNKLIAVLKFSSPE